MRKSSFKVSVIIPIFNEEGCVEKLIESLTLILEGYHDYEILFIDDGSSDKSLLLIKQLREKNNKIKFVSFSRNFGHQNALRAGINHANGDCMISLDGDFQHPPELIPEMIEKWQNDYDIVYSIRKDEQEISFFKKLTSKIFYKILKIFADINLENGEADFRLIDKKVSIQLNRISENALFLRGMIKWLGFKAIGIEYVPNKRFAGKSKYSLKKMMSLAFAGITSFSVKPLTMSFFIGIFVACLSIIYGFYALYKRLFTNETVEGWTSVFLMVSFIGGIQLIMIGILGEYLGKLFIESKKRPNYIINESSYD
jgi:polyisoprenyl-phosphate glycosyltransferase